MDLCRPIRIQSINGKKYILVIIDDFSRFTWVKFLRSKDEVPDKDLGKLQPKADIRIFVGYAPTKKALWIYNRITRLIIETIHVTFDELTAMASEQFSLRPGPQLMTPATPTPSVSPTKKDWEILFQPMFDEYFSPPTSVASPVPTVVALVPADSTSSPSSTSVDQDAPLPSTSQTPQETKPPVLSSSVEE
ncbi:integrase, catalytic region, zinc finger, CCHC-type containing protein [Tanacetum coccineum]